MMVRLAMLSLLLLLSACDGSDTIDDAVDTVNDFWGIGGDDDDKNRKPPQDPMQVRIRDDVMTYIDEHFSYSTEVRRAAEQQARAIQQLLDATNKEMATVAAEQLGRAASCIAQVLPEPVRDFEKRKALFVEIEAQTVNNKDRVSRYFAANRLVQGVYFTEPVEPFCD